MKNKKHYLFICLLLFTAGLIVSGFSSKVAGTYTDEANEGTEQVTLTSSDEIKDIDGNVYHSVTIGTQVWMIENLKTTRYNDSTEIPNIKKQAKWDDFEKGAWCDYDNDHKNAEIYGKLYNGYAANSGKLCPPGWHVPTRKDWKTLINYLGGDSVAGVKLQAFNPKRTLVSSETLEPLPFNSSGFTALPAGRRLRKFLWLKLEACFWTSTEYCFKDGHCHLAHYITMNIPSLKVELDEVGSKSVGMSVRCIKD